MIARVLAALIAAAPLPALACEVALVLSIDVSGSVDEREYRLQMDGLATALTDPTVADALVEAKAMVAVMQWSGTSRQAVSVGWTEIVNHNSVAALSRQVTEATRAWRHFSTAIGEALGLAAELHGEIAGKCRRAVVDVSGDGPSNEGVEVGRMRDALVRGGVQINGLAIETTEEGLTTYYRREVVGGPGAFVMTAKTFEDYPRAIRRKLLREITKPVVEAPAPAQRCSARNRAGKAPPKSSCG